MKYILQFYTGSGNTAAFRAVLSWNVLQAPEANLEAAASVPG